MRAISHPGRRILRRWAGIQLLAVALSAAAHDGPTPNRVDVSPKLSTSGPVMSRWQMDETGGILRVITQRGSSRTINGEAYPDIDTFRIESSSSMLRLGHTTMRLPRQEGLKSVRFDGPRAYAITAYTEPTRVTDPLFTIDLSDPANPTQKGELEARLFCVRRRYRSRFIPSVATISPARAPQTSPPPPREHPWDPAPAPAGRTDRPR